MTLILKNFATTYFNTTNMTQWTFKNQWNN